MKDEQGNPNRRRFLKDLGRWVLALGLGGGVAAIVDRDPEQCLRRGICRGCPELDGCHLPQALSLKEATRPRS